MTRPEHSAASEDPVQLLHSIADHLHDHCTCMPEDGEASRRDGAVCDACDMRAQLRGVRDDVLAWRALGRRVQQRRAETLDGSATYLGRHAAHCATCAGLSSVALALRELRAHPRGS